MTTATSETKLGKLRRFNLIMGFFHLVQGFLMLVLSSDFALPVTTAFQVFERTGRGATISMASGPTSC